MKGLPFYNWSEYKTVLTQANRITTFNNAIGLPQKEGKACPLFDYEMMLFGILQNNKHVWIKKATGLGVTEFMLRYMAWLCFNNDFVYGQANSITKKDTDLALASTKPVSIRGTQMCIVTGPRIELAITLIYQDSDYPLLT